MADRDDPRDGYASLARSAPPSNWQYPPTDTDATERVPAPTFTTAPISGDLTRDQQLRTWALDAASRAYAGISSRGTATFYAERETLTLARSFYTWLRDGDEPRPATPDDVPTFDPDDEEANFTPWRGDTTLDPSLPPHRQSDDTPDSLDPS